MTRDKDTSKRILKAALKEFSAHGYGGARMDSIAKAAKVNKAMIFYYFSSKEQLHRAVVKDIFDIIAPMFSRLVMSDPTPEEFIEQATAIYADLYTKHPFFVKMVAMELIQNSRTITSAIKSFFIEKGPPGPQNISGLLNKWKNEGRLVEENPYHFMLNLVTLGLLSFIASPFVESLFGLEAESKKPGPERMASVARLLKRGMLVSGIEENERKTVNE